MDYRDFLASKLATVPPTGIDPPDVLHPRLKPFQVDITKWALRRGRSAIFANTGLGKTCQSLEWARHVHEHTGAPVLILAPLAVAPQTVGEGLLLGLDVNHCRSGNDVVEGINITNYDRLHLFDPEEFGAVVLDESGIIKHHDTKTLAVLLEAFRSTPFKLCCTATPAPNDWTELGTHAEFLGICTRTEMLSEFFVHDGGDTQSWRLKGHARGAFWRWVASWAALVAHPRDLGYDEPGYDLPPLTVHEHTIKAGEAEARAAGLLFVPEAGSLIDRRRARKVSIDARVVATGLEVYTEWCKLTAEVIRGVEEGIRRESSTEDRGGSRTSTKVEGADQAREQSAGAVGIHAPILPGAPRKVRTKDAGEEGQIQRSSQGSLRKRRRMEGSAQVESSGVGREEPGEKEGAESSQIRIDARDVHGISGGSRREVCDLQLRAEAPNERLDVQRKELLPGDRPLPQDGSGARDSVHELQSRAREVQRRIVASSGGSRILEPWLIWCDLNAEQDALEEVFGDFAFSVRGADSADFKEETVLKWLRLERPVMISKSSIMGWGLNFQHCARMAFVGVTDSFEAYYQALRRCWRFGQKRAVEAHVFASEAEGAVVQNLKRKEADAEEMARALSLETAAIVRESVRGAVRETNDYSPAASMRVPDWLKSEVTA